MCAKYTKQGMKVMKDMSDSKAQWKRITVTLDEILSILSKHHMNSHGEDFRGHYCLLGRQEEDGSEVLSWQNSSGEFTVVDECKLESSLKLAEVMRHKQRGQHSCQK